MNRTFNVLDPQLDICGNFLLEASAGTGKTFTIAHLVARFVLEPTHDMPLKKMAIITFTKASASELKKRIKELFLELKEKTQNNLPTFFDSFEIDRNHLLLKIDLAIETLDEAFIQTIHGFSFRLLKKFAPQLNLFIPQEQEEAQDLEKLSYDFIYEELTSDSIGQVLKPFQLQTLLGSHRGSLHQLILALRQKILNDIDIKTPKTFEESKQEILQSIRSFSKQFSFENLVDVAYKFKYTGITKEEVAEQILSFLNVVFENQPLESVIFKPCFLNFLEEENLKKIKLSI